MSKFLSRFSGNKQKGSRLSTKIHKLTDSSQSSSPSISDLDEIAIFSFNFTQLQTINNILESNLQIIRPTTTKSLYKYLLRIQKTLVIFQYLIQVGSEDFINSWKHYETGMSNPHYDLLTTLLENLETIENSNLCQDQGYVYASSLTSSKKNNIRGILSSTINKLSTLKNYLSDDEDLQQFRLSFQKLRFDMSKPTPRSSMDNVPRSSINGGSRNSLSSRPIYSMNRTASTGRNYHMNSVKNSIIDENDDFNKIDFQLMKPNVDITENILNVSKRRQTSSIQEQQKPRSFSSSKSLDLNRMINTPSTPHNTEFKRSQATDFKNFSNRLSLSGTSATKFSSPLSRSTITASDIEEEVLNSEKNLGTLIEVNEQPLV